MQKVNLREITGTNKSASYRQVVHFIEENQDFVLGMVEPIMEWPSDSTGLRFTVCFKMR